jgi:hypothetical protein
MYIALMVLSRQMLTAEPLELELSSLEVEIAIQKLKVCKSPDIDQILAELIQA